MSATDWIKPIGGDDDVPRLDIPAPASKRSANRIDLADPEPLVVGDSEVQEFNEAVFGDGRRPSRGTIRFRRMRLSGERRIARDARDAERRQRRRRRWMALRPAMPKRLPRRPRLDSPLLT